MALVLGSTLAMQAAAGYAEGGDEIEEFSLLGLEARRDQPARQQNRHSNVGCFLVLVNRSIRFLFGAKRDRNGSDR